MQISAKGTSTGGKGDGESGVCCREPECYGLMGTWSRDLKEERLQTPGEVVQVERRARVRPPGRVQCREELSESSCLEVCSLNLRDDGQDVGLKAPSISVSQPILLLL